LKPVQPAWIPVPDWLALALAQPPSTEVQPALAPVQRAAAQALPPLAQALPTGLPVLVQACPGAGCFCLGSGRRLPRCRSPENMQAREQWSRVSRLSQEKFSSWGPFSFLHLGQRFTPDGQPSADVHPNCPSGEAWCSGVFRGMASNGLKPGAFRGMPE
jgi:hypothetical protein